MSTKFHTYLRKILLKLGLNTGTPWVSADIFDSSSYVVDMVNLFLILVNIQISESYGTSNGLRPNYRQFPYLQ